MPVSSDDVAEAIRHRLPGVPTKKLHKLLYYAQGHHLAATGEPLFREAIVAYDMGPVVEQLWKQERDGEPRALPEVELDESQLNSVGYVVSRYGGLTGHDLEVLSHAEDPWRDADRRRAPHGRANITTAALRVWFGTDEPDDDDMTGRLDPAEVRQWLEGAASRREGAGRPDDLEALRTRLAQS